MDKLEKYIRNNRSRLDLLEPSPGVWKRIERNSSSHQKNRHLFKIAASVAVLTVISVLFFIAGDRYRTNKLASTEKNPMLIETEIYYKGVINTMLNDAKPVLDENPDLKKELFSDIAILDSICSDIKRDLKDNVSNQEVIEAVIRNYRFRIRILEEMLGKITSEDTSKVKTTSHEL